MKNIWEIKSFNFTGWDGEKVKLQEAKNQIDEMIEKCAINTVNITLGAKQEHTYSVDIKWKGQHMLSDEKFIELIQYSKKKGLKVIVKPMVNTMDGYWRAFIRFFDEDVPCEPKWGDWFKSYTEYMLHYAELAEKYEVDMIIIGCELVGTDHRQQEWRELISKVRKVYSGLLTYNCDKYQEHNVKWWDALDVISSSGYYPMTDWDNQIKRIQAVIDEYNKPFFFSETGCPATKGASKVPNDWNVIGRYPVDLEEQALYFKTMFEKCKQLKNHFGYSLWDWSMSAEKNQPGDYSVLDKPAEKIIKEYF